MNCPNCNKKIKDTDKICKYCDADVNKKSDIEIFIGRKYNFIKDQNISLSALLFGPFYLLYRKIYQESIILILLFLVTSIFLNSNIDILLKIAIHFILAISFKQIYFNNAERKISRIKNINSEKEQSEIDKLIEKEGSTLRPIILITIFVLYIGIIAIMNNRDSNNTKNIENNEQIDTNIIEKIEYNIPSNIKINENKDNYQYYTYKQENESCYIIISTNHSKKYTTADEYLVDRKNEYINSTTNIEEETYNKIKWKILKIQNENNKQDIYAIKYNNIIYEFSLESSSNRNTCKYPKEYILNSIKLN